MQRVIDVDCAVHGRDLGGVASAVQHEINNLGKLPAGTHVVIRGQSQAMRDSFRTLGEGLVLAIVLVYLLMVANFQSWLEPFIIMMAVPGALAGVLWMLAITGTTINVESLMGAIMAVGVGVANGNLLITFANELREEGYSPLAAAIEAGRIRFRPIIMTALAMILGMLPMALSLGSGSEQNAPLGRAVIGGLMAATMMTLFVVPAVYSIFGRDVIGKKAARRRDRSSHAARCVELINMPDREEDDPKTFSVPAPGGFFFAGWIIAIIIASGRDRGPGARARAMARPPNVGSRTATAAGAARAGLRRFAGADRPAHLKLPATIRGFDETDIYAKVPGYLKTIKVDKGDRIHTGELIAILTSPELDQQTANARANYNLALVTDKRNQELVHAQVIPQQTADDTHCAMLQDARYPQTGHRLSGLRDNHGAVRRHRHGALYRSRPPRAREYHARHARFNGAIISVLHAWLRCACLSTCRRT